MLFFAVDKKPRPIELKTKPQSNNDSLAMPIPNVYLNNTTQGLHNHSAVENKMG
jgi:hypothetical protein